ncbi:hypothetical protein Moror_13060 [Moniliophthora roreri MCA 2997]|uniref:Uncharacterized protein n=1 Tax=Moniliophthora roreri (strain MCA 2997) TaxID=1381753 RepID=V2XMT1_MONRO|nr:hypothetical protein Moror_13060 [Moniliophthora roreri MCA 2997]
MESPSQAWEKLGPVLDTLVALVKDWLHGIIDALHLYRLLIGIQPPHPNYPLPVEFPLGPSISQTFTWVQILDDAKQIRMSFRVELGFSEGNVERWEPIMWSVYSGNVVLGSLQLDRRVYADYQFSRACLDPIFVLENLLQAITLRQRIIVSTRIVMLQPKTPAPFGWRVWNEIVEIPEILPFLSSVASTHRTSILPRAPVMIIFHPQVSVKPAIQALHVRASPCYTWLMSRTY